LHTEYFVNVADERALDTDLFLESDFVFDTLFFSCPPEVRSSVFVETGDDIQ